MKFVLAAAIVALTSLALPVAAKPCDENVSDAMKRPGGFCEAVVGTSSLSTPTETEKTLVAETEPYQNPYDDTQNEAD